MKRIRTIPLGNSLHPALVDEEDHTAVSAYSWCVSTGHVVARVDGRAVLGQRQVGRYK